MCQRRGLSVAIHEELGWYLQEYITYNLQNWSLVFAHWINIDKTKYSLSGALLYDEPLVGVPPITYDNRQNLLINRRIVTYWRQKEVGFSSYYCGCAFTYSPRVRTELQWRAMKFKMLGYSTNFSVQSKKIIHWPVLEILKSLLGICSKELV